MTTRSTIFRVWEKPIGGDAVLVESPPGGHVALIKVLACSSATGAAAPVPLYLYDPAGATQVSLPDLELDSAGHAVVYPWWVLDQGVYLAVGTTTEILRFYVAGADLPPPLTSP